MRTDRRTDMTKLIVAFRNFVKAPINCSFVRCSCGFQLRSVVLMEDPRLSVLEKGVLEKELVLRGRK
jgi:hypothetical protein